MAHHYAPWTPMSALTTLTACGKTIDLASPRNDVSFKQATVDCERCKVQLGKADSQMWTLWAQRADGIAPPGVAALMWQRARDLAAQEVSTLECKLNDARRALESVAATTQQRIAALSPRDTDPRNTDET